MKNLKKTICVTIVCGLFAAFTTAYAGKVPRIIEPGQEPDFHDISDC